MNRDVAINVRDVRSVICYTSPIGSVQQGGGAAVWPLAEAPRVTADSYSKYTAHAASETANLQKVSHELFICEMCEPLQ